MARVVVTFKPVAAKMVVTFKPVVVKTVHQSKPVVAKMVRQSKLVVAKVTTFKLVAKVEKVEKLTAATPVAMFLHHPLQKMTMPLRTRLSIKPRLFSERPASVVN